MFHLIISPYNDQAMRSFLTNPVRFDRRFRTHQRGFTIVELSVVLIIIGLILGTVSIAKDVQRNAVYQRIASDFVQGWAIAYDRFHDGNGVPPGDNAAAPTGRVAGAVDTPLCGAALIAVMQAAGIAMPQGRTEGSPDLYAYLDSNGNPQQVQVCFENVSWSEPDAVPGNFVVRQRNVMVLRNLTPALANLLDNQFDTVVDARFGRLREQGQAANLGAAGIPWGTDERTAFGDNVPTARDESQVAVMLAYLRMSR
jgi:prepilin-type N-terminal cleavage/methylation domain-containing protein